MGAWARHPCRSHPCHRTHPAFDSFPRLSEMLMSEMLMLELLMLVGADRWSARGRVPLLRNGL